ncbi:MAG: glycosyltransferase family 4 protein [Brooklawnia sp.]|uniref:glycosyltransferase family 4 protein n=1 Tax=Brooklawnia sp. TaxID=2699740 RepID=UPI003C742787
MRIGLIAPPWVPVPPVTYGGTELVIDELARGLQAVGHQVLLAASADSTCPVPMVPGVRESDFGALNDATSLLSHLIVSYAAMRDVDIIHDHTLGGPLYRGRPPAIPTVVTNHLPFTDATNVLFRELDRDTTIVAISQNQASHAIGLTVGAVIHHGIDVASVPVGTGQGGFTAVLARMNPSKGIVEALHIAQAAGVPLRIAAKMREPEELDYFNSEVRPLLTSEHQYLGELSTTDKLALLGEAFALLNPIQWSEPFGLTMIEALSAGTPVVGTPRGSAPEIVRHGLTGFLANTDELVQLLPKAAELDRAVCRAEAESRFTSRRMVDDHIRLYSKILTGAAGQPPLRRDDAVSVVRHSSDQHQPNR